MEKGGQHHDPVTLSRGMTIRYSMEAGWAPEPFWAGAEILASTGIRAPDAIKYDKLINCVRENSTRQTNSKSYGQKFPRILCTQNFQQHFSQHLTCPLSASDQSTLQLHIRSLPRSITPIVLHSTPMWFATCQTHIIPCKSFKSIVHNKKTVFKTRQYGRILQQKCESSFRSWTKSMLKILDAS
jgi:hypothetical protein